MRVCIKNPTGMTAPAITVAGQAVNNQITCTGPDMLNSYSYTFMQVPPGVDPDEDHCKVLPETATGIVSGMYVHRIVVTSTDPDQEQYQQGPVLFDASENWPTITWTYFPHVFEVTNTGDSSASGTLRTAIAMASSVATATSPALVRFTSSGQGEIEITGILPMIGPWVTIDGTDNQGNPWIVGDRAAYLAGYQDPFPVTIDLNNVASLRLRGDSTLKGLHIKNTVTSGSLQSRNLVISFDPGNIIRAVKIDGGNTFNCTSAGCSGPYSLFQIQEEGTASLINVEGHSALDKGVKVSTFNAPNGATLIATIEDSWFHHNYRGGIQATTPPPTPGVIPQPMADVRRTHVELSGRRCSPDQERTCSSCAVGNLNQGDPCAKDSDCDDMTEGDGLGTCDTDNAIVDNGANGLAANARKSSVVSQESLFWLNRNNGISARNGEAMYMGEADHSCGNRFSGLGLNQGNSAGTDADAHGGAFVYNGGEGVFLAGTLSSSGAHLTPNNVFTQNDPTDDPENDPSCEVRNDGTELLDVRQNQWPSPTPSTCGSGPIDDAEPQDYVNDLVELDLLEPFFPSNVILEGQTIRIHGAGFNAVDGNPAPNVENDDCARGDDPTESCCLLAPAAANVCGYNGSEYVPVEDAGMCVQIRVPNASFAWQPLSVTALTPTMIVTEIPEDYVVFGCKGDDATIKVSKQRDSGPQSKEGKFCTNEKPALL